MPPARRRAGRELALAAVHPVQRQRQLPGKARQHLADMTGAEQCDRPQGRLGQVSGEIVARRDAGKAQPHHAAAALAKARAERVAHLLGQVAARQRGTRAGDGVELQMAAADRARQPLGRHRHPGADLARHAALGARDGDQHRVGHVQLPR